ncbi:hypothetical protein ABZP36_020585 [Zizania latifolia]
MVLRGYVCLFNFNHLTWPSGSDLPQQAASKISKFELVAHRTKRKAAEKVPVPNRAEHFRVERVGKERKEQRKSKGEMVEIGARFMDKVEAAAADEEDGTVGGEEGDLWPVEPLPEPPDDAGPVGWPMPGFCPITIGAVKESFLEALRKEAEQPLPEPEPEPEPQSPESRPSSSKRQRAGTGSPPSSRRPYRNILQVFQQCKQDVG